MACVLDVFPENSKNRKFATKEYLDYTSWLILAVENLLNKEMRDDCISHLGQILYAYILSMTRA